MARGKRQDLFLNVSGDVSGLQAATRTGRTVLNEFSGAAINVIDEVEKEFAKIGSTGLPQLKQVEKSYDATFRRIRESARAVLDAPTPQAAAQIVDASAARQSAADATAKAAALRLTAEAASRADAALGGLDAATRAYAVAAGTAAIEAEREAEALRDQAVVLGRVEQQLGTTGSAQRRAVAVSGQAKAGYQQLSFQLGDVATQYASGTAASIIFAQQSGQVIQAISLISGEAKGFIGFLGGPWGIALSSAAVVATPWVAKLLEGGDALEKETQRLKDNAANSAIADQAKKAFSSTTEGLIDDVRQLTAEIEKENDALKTNAERLNIRSKNRLEALSGRRSDVADQLAAARTGLSALQQPGVSSERGAGSAIAAAKAEVAKLEGTLRQVDLAIAAANAARLETQRDLASEAASRANDPIAQITRRYEGADGLIEQAKKRASAEEVVNGALTRQLTTLRAQQKAETEAAQKRIAAANRPDASRAGVTPKSVSKLLTDEFGGAITSTTGGKHVPNSFHYRGQAVDFVPRGGVGSVTKDQIRSFLEAQGVNIKELLGPGDRGHNDHFHVAFGKNQRGQDEIDRRRTSAEARVEAQGDRRTQNADAYASLLSSTKEQQLRLERGRVTTISEAADLDVAAVEAARADIDRAAQKGVELEKWTQAEADAVKAVAAQNALTETATIRERERLQLMQRKFEIEQADLDDKATLLRLQSDLAATAGDRRRIARQLLKIEQDQVEAALKQQIASTDDPDRRASLQRRLDQVPQEYELKGEKLERDNADPLQRYGQKIVDSTSDMNEALKGVAADGFEAVEDGLVDIISGTESVAGAFKKMANQIIADLIRIAVQKAIVNAVGKSFFGLADGGKVADIPGRADGGLVGYAGGGIPFVDRGLIRGPGTGRSDSILALVGGRRPIKISNGEGIVNERAVKRYWPIIDAMNKGKLPAFADGGLVASTNFPRLPNIGVAQQAMQAGSASSGGALTVHVTLSDDLNARIDNRAAGVSVEVMRQNAPGFIEGAKTATIAELRRASL